MIRLLLVSHYYPAHRGGVEIIAGELAQRLASDSVSITWIASATDPGPVEHGIAVEPVPACNAFETRWGIPYPLWSPRGLARTFRAAREADVVHLHDCLYLGNVVAFLGARWYRKPVLVTQHIGLVPYRNPLLRGSMSAANRVLGRLVLRGAARVVFYSDKVQQYFSGLFTLPRPAVLIRNGVDRKAFFPVGELERAALREKLELADDRPTILFVGRFVEKKGMPVMRRLAKLFGQYDWLFAGWGPDEPAGWGLPNVRQLGTVPHEALADYYRAADLLLLPSVGEGFPLVIQEALSCGLPTVMSADTAQGCPEVQQVAWACAPDATTLAALLSGILADGEGLKARRQRCAEFAAAHWDWDRCAEAYLAQLRELQPQRVVG